MSLAESNASEDGKKSIERPRIPSFRGKSPEELLSINTREHLRSDIAELDFKRRHSNDEYRSLGEYLRPSLIGSGKMQESRVRYISQVLSEGEIRVVMDTKCIPNSLGAVAYKNPLDILAMARIKRMTDEELKFANKYLPNGKENCARYTLLRDAWGKEEEYFLAQKLRHSPTFEELDDEAKEIHLDEKFRAFIVMRRPELMIKYYD